MIRTAVHVCAKCDAQSPKWTGQCLECGSWGTVSAEAVAASPAPHAASAVPDARPADVSPLAEAVASGVHRITTGIGEADRVLGGGVVPGSVTLIGGEPGVGKSTLTLLIAARAATAGHRVLYVSGEESAGQVKMRADRLGLETGDRLLFLPATDVDIIIATIRKELPMLAVIDSVQMLKSDAVPSEAGAVGQLRGATAKLVGLAKASDASLVLIGHVTKDGNVAGPKTLEHLVDTVLSFEGERSSGLRILRSLKNRFGSTEEAGIFAMEDRGLVEVRNPSAYLLDARRDGQAGDVISCVLEGTRPILVEVQALVRKTPFGYPARRASGIDLSRLEMIIAVLGARGGVDLGQHDVFVNVVGGMRLREPSTDLAIALALASAHAGRPVPAGTAVWGEIGLGGEIRPASGTERRLAEAKALGMTAVITAVPERRGRAALAARVTAVRDLREALRTLLPG